MGVCLVTLLHELSHQRGPGGFLRRFQGAGGVDCGNPDPVLQVRRFPTGAAGFHVRPAKLLSAWLNFRRCSAKLSDSGAQMRLGLFKVCTGYDISEFHVHFSFLPLVLPCAAVCELSKMT